jgi:uncharacterized RDD family membrane protein YckC
MKNELNKRIHQLGVAALCGLWLAGASSPAQDTTTLLTNEPPDTLATSIHEAASNMAGALESEGGLRVRRHRGGQQNVLVVFGKDAELKAGETADAVVVVGGNAIVRGKVRDAAVAVGGNLTISGEVGDAAVAVMGRITLETNAIVHGDAVSVGGPVTVAEGAVLKGEKIGVDFNGIGLPKIEPLRKWFVHCVLKLRPLAPQVGWVWAVVGIAFLLYLLVAVALPRPVEQCFGELTRRPTTTFFMGLLAKLLLPVVLLILAATGIGLIVVPFVLAALFFGAIIGKVAFLEYLGHAVQKAFGVTDGAKTIIALVIGSAILVMLYMVPVLGLLTYWVTGMWGLGAAVTAAFDSMKRETSAKSTSPPSAPRPPPTNTPPGGMAPMPVTSAAATAAPASATETAIAPDAGARVQEVIATSPGASPSPTAALPDALAYPRASFWERMGAAFLDVALVGILGGLAGSFALLVALAYFGGMWTWKGTTIGGIVLNLKVVRLDGSPLTFAAALVRGLAAAFSVVVLFLGFLWIIWDKEKQGWHDRIAGTVVVRLPRGLPLVCL